MDSQTEAPLQTSGEVCGADGCSTLSSDPGPTDAPPAPRALDLEIISDAICPWCWVAKHRLTRALNHLPAGVVGKVTWRPFELNPGMPVEGMDRRAYRSAKFGSWERSHALDAQVADAARPDGLEFRHDLIARTPNTIAAHRLVWLAQRFGKQDEVVEALFSAYFHEGRDVGDPDTLIEIGTEAGIDPVAIIAMYDSDEGRAEVEKELERASTMAIRGVPTVLVNGEPIFSGAIPAAEMVAKLREAAAHAAQ